MATRKRRTTTDQAALPPPPPEPLWMRFAVTVNHGTLRRGDEFEAEVNPYLEGLLNAGYIELLGPVFRSRSDSTSSPELTQAASSVDTAPEPPASAEPSSDPDPTPASDEPKEADDGVNSVPTDD